MAKGFEGTDEAIQNTEAMIKRLKGKEFRQALLPGAKIFHDKGQDYAPYDPERKRGTHLRDAFFIDTRQHQSEQTDVLVGVNRRKAPHAHLQEFGWSNNPGGHPFLRPARAATQDQVQREVAGAVKKQVENK